MSAPDPPVEPAALDVAEAACRTALARDFGDPVALRQLGLTLLARGKPAQAVAMLAEVAAARPDVESLNDLGRALLAAGLSHEAETRFRDALRLRRDCVASLVGLGRVLLARDCFSDAVATLRQAMDAAPTDPEARDLAVQALVSQGNAALSRNDPTEAERIYREALALTPGLVPALSNLGNALVASHQPDQALDQYRQALARDPDNANTGYAYALALLTAGEYQDGWKYHERRRQVDPMRWNYDRRPDLPQWRDGMVLDGRRVLLLAEQGAGDMLQFVRYAPMLAERGAQIVLEARRPLQRLFDGMAGVARVVGPDDPVTDCDLACPLMSLPLLFGTTLDTIPPPVADLTVPEELLGRWSNWLGPIGKRRRVGIVCSGDPRHPNDAARSIPLRQLTPILSRRDHLFTLLQTELRPADRAVRDRLSGLRFPGAALTDYADTAALILQLDLVVTVDTSVAHLAGTLGKPVWLMLAHAADYRWMLGRSDTPWYPSMTLYRQTRAGDWDAVIETIGRDITRL